LISSLWVFPAALKLRDAFPDVHRPYRVPGGAWGMWAATELITFRVAVGSWVAVFPGTLERLFGLEYDFVDTWDVSQVKFSTPSLGTLAVALLGYATGAAVRRQDGGLRLERTLTSASAVVQAPARRGGPHAWAEPQRIAGDASSAARSGRRSCASVACSSALNVEIADRSASR